MKKLTLILFLLFASAAAWADFVEGYVCRVNRVTTASTGSEAWGGGGVMFIELYSKPGCNGTALRKDPFSIAFATKPAPACYKGTYAMTSDELQSAALTIQDAAANKWLVSVDLWDKCVTKYGFKIK